MCQAYEAEAAAIRSAERRASMAGYEVAKKGKPVTENPFTSGYQRYEKEAWDHGWSCYHHVPRIVVK